MKPDNASRQLNLTLLLAVLGAMSMGAGASPPKTVSKTQQPVGTPHKASSFAPHPTKRRVFGAPIQPPIVSPPAPPKQ
jgi:hypothetical protein